MDNELKRAPCPGCGVMVDVYRDTDGDPCWRWSGEACSSCGWFTEETLDIELQDIPEKALGLKTCEKIIAEATADIEKLKKECIRDIKDKCQRELVDTGRIAPIADIKIEIIYEETLDIELQDIPKETIGLKTREKIIAETVADIDRLKKNIYAILKTEVI